MNEKKRDELLSQYNHLLTHYKFIPQNQINDWVRKLITSQTQHVTELITNFKVEGFYRGRTHNCLEGLTSNYNTELFTCESQFWNPPIEFCRIGRCNDINESLLYCSPELSTVIVETKPKKGEFLTIAQFKQRNPDTYKGARIKYIGYKTLSQIDSVKHIFNEAHEDDAEKQELDETLDELFHKQVSIEDQQLYRLSIAVTKSIMATLFDPEQNVYYQTRNVIFEY